MTPLQSQKLADELTELYKQLENDLMLNIATQLSTHNKITDTAKWQAKKLAEMGALNKTNLQTIMQYAKNVPSLLSVALENAGYDAIKELEPTLQKVAKKGIISDAKVPVSQSIIQAVKAYKNQAYKSLNMVNTVMQYKSKQAYKSIIKSTAELATKQQFLDILNKTTGEVVTGAISRQQALRQTLKEFNAKGIPAFVDKRGREWSPEAYINMDIRTTVNNVAHQAQDNLLDNYDIDLIEISSHSGSRPKCAKDQGKIFDRKNKSKKYPHWNSSSYGEPDGILGINCGHHKYPYIEGISIKRYLPTENIEENDKLYKSTQQQRFLEREVKNQKRECLLFDKIGDKEQFEKSAVLLKSKQTNLKQFCNAKDMPYKSDRVQTDGYNKKISSKVNSANRIDKINKNAILKSKIDDGSITVALNVEKQNRHIKETDEYIDGRSYLTISIDEIQQLIISKSGTGNVIIKSNGQIKEIILCDKNIGFDVNYTKGIETATNRAIIHYSKTGTHLVPTKPF